MLKKAQLWPFTGAFQVHLLGGWIL